MKTMKTKLGCILLTSTLLALSLNAQEAKVTVHVTDENGPAISNAHVSVGFMIAMKPGEGWGSAGENNVKIKTDTNGY
jgi:hypothetical protein